MTLDRWEPSLNDIRKIVREGKFFSTQIDGSLPQGKVVWAKVISPHFGIQFFDCGSVGFEVSSDKLLFLISGLCSNKFKLSSSETDKDSTPSTSLSSSSSSFLLFSNFSRKNVSMSNVGFFLLKSRQHAMFKTGWAQIWAFRILQVFSLFCLFLDIVKF